MSLVNFAIDELLAASLRGEPANVGAMTHHPAAVVERIDYHGIAGLLRGFSGSMTDWPAEIRSHVEDAAVGQAMWELRHRFLLNDLLGELAGAGIVAILLKGTALGYDLYPVAATRARGDTDLLVDPGDLAATRRILARHGFERLGGDVATADDFSLQEVWSRTCDRAMAHDVDLHWHLLNAPALQGFAPFAECAATRIGLPLLGPDAWAMDRVRTLIHTSIHRMLNFSSPYFVNDRTYYGGDRLIWIFDIHLLAKAFSDAEWDALCHLACMKGVSAACLDGLLTAERILSTPIPLSVRNRLADASCASAPAAYLRARQLGRAWQDLQAIPGWARKLRYVRARAMPSSAFVRDKYPRHARLPLPFLYARRLFDLLRARPSQGKER